MTVGGSKQQEYTVIVCSWGLCGMFQMMFLFCCGIVVVHMQFLESSQPIEPGDVGTNNDGMYGQQKWGIHNNNPYEVLPKVNAPNKHFFEHVAVISLQSIEVLGSWFSA